MVGTPHRSRALAYWWTGTLVARRFVAHQLIAVTPATSAPVKLQWRQEDCSLWVALLAERAMPTDRESAGCQYVING
jgi:hypothetical protein